MDITPALPGMLLRLRDVKVVAALSRSSIYAYVRQGLFPKPVRVGCRAVAWPAAEIAAINQARVAGASDDEIRGLVAKLHTRRGDAKK